MKLPLLSLCLSLSILAQAQSFRWNDDADAVTEKGDVAVVDYTGIAQIYPDYHEGNPTALGEIFSQQQKTAAHKKLPLGTIVKVTRLDNGLTTTVRINDRGAYCDECVIDLSKAAAQELDLLGIGQARVKLTVIGSSSSNPSSYGVTAGIGQEPRFTSRGIQQPATQEYQTVPPSPNAYQLRDEPVLKARTPEPTSTMPSSAVTTTNLPSTPATGLTTSTGQVNIIDVPISPFSVQLGAYGNYSNAERHVLKLQGQGFNNIFLLKELAKDGTALHRVIVAPFLSLEDAHDYAEDLADYHQIKGLVFQTKLVEVD
jgi:rare lipoprotein A